MFEDLKKDSVWAVTDSVLLFIVGALLSCYESENIVSSALVVRRLPFDIALEDFNIFPLLKPRHFNVLSTLWKVPEMPKVERQKIVLRVFHCKRISNVLKDVPDDLKLAVIASRCWLKVISENIDHHFKAFVVALVFCLQVCFNKSNFERRRYLPNNMTALDRIHYLAQWECMLCLANIFNQILDYPFAYASLGKLFSATCFQDCFVKDPGFFFARFDETGRIMYAVITKGLLPEAPQPHPRQVAPRQQGITTIQNKYEVLTSKKV